MATFPISSLGNVLFGNLSQGKAAGVEIFTDNSKFFRREATRLQIAPQNIEFAQRARISEQTIKDGRAFFFWRKDRFSDHLDLLEIRIGGITRSLAVERAPTGIPGIGGGDIESLFIPSQTPTSSGGEVAITPKQRDWLRFWKLTREPFITENGFNYHHIRLQTPALPLPVEFVGHFAGPIDWRQDAQNPFLVNWQLTLIVHRTKPDLEVLFSQAETFQVV